MKWEQMWRLTAERELMSMLSTSLADQVGKTLQGCETTTVFGKERNGKGMRCGKRQGKAFVPIVTIC